MTTAPELIPGHSLISECGRGWGAPHSTRWYVIMSLAANRVEKELASCLLAAAHCWMVQHDLCESTRHSRGGTASCGSSWCRRPHSVNFDCCLALVIVCVEDRGLARMYVCVCICDGTDAYRSMQASIRSPYRASRTASPLCVMCVSHQQPPDLMMGTSNFLALYPTRSQPSMKSRHSWATSAKLGQPSRSDCRARTGGGGHQVGLGA